MKTTGLSLFIFILQHLGQCLAQSWLSIPICGVEKKNDILRMSLKFGNIGE